VLQYQSQEGYTTQGAGFCLFGLAVPVTEGDLPMLVGEDVFLLYHTPIQIAPKVDQGVLSSANRFGSAGSGLTFHAQSLIYPINSIN
jgi:hypothetical protein